MPASIRAAFDKFHEKNPQIFKLFRKYARRARASGYKRYSADAILHRIRWYLSVEVNKNYGDLFKINNNFSSRYARKLIHEDKTFSKFFELRVLKRD